MADEQRCRQNVPGCCCDYHDPEWIAFAAEYGIELPEVDDVCRHHRQQEVLSE